LIASSLGFAGIYYIVGVGLNVYLDDTVSANTLFQHILRMSMMCKGTPELTEFLYCSQLSTIGAGSFRKEHSSKTTTGSFGSMVLPSLSPHNW